MWHVTYITAAAAAAAVADNTRARAVLKTECTLPA